MTVLINCHICFLLVFLTVFSKTLGDLKICTTVDCPNDHIEVQDGVNGAIHRYSKNAANFHEAKVSPSSAKVVQHNKGHGNQPSTKTTATAQRQHLTVADGHTIHQQPHVSVLGDGGRRDQKLQLQHTQEVREPQLQPQPSNKHLQQQRHHHHQQQQQQQRQLNPNHLQHSTTKDPSDHIPSSGEKHDSRNVTGRVHAVEGGFFWSATVEGAIPPGLSDAVAETWKKRIRQLRVVKVENASLDKCGSNMNRHVVFDDGTTACARYRHPMVQFVLGDLYCYYLARMLGMQNVPTVVYSHVSNESSSQWSSVAADISTAGWKNDTVASFSLWINDLGNSHLPEIMYNNQRETIYPSTPGLADLNITELVELAQYSDLIVFDYITAHLDRMTIRKNAVEYYQQDWLYGGEIHNLAKHKTNRGLWFIDNENGIFNSYVVAYNQGNKEQMLGYHEELLRSFCIFRRSTYDKVHELASMEDPFEVLDKLVHENEPVVAVEYNRNLFVNVNERFKKRLSSVVNWMDNCQSRSSD